MEETGPLDERPMILICDDEPALRELMRVVLDSKYRYAEAADGIEATDLASGLHPDLVLLDLMMPRRDGFEVLRWLRHDVSLSHTPVVVVSAFSGERERNEASALGADEFISKPFDPEELATTVERLLGRGG